MYISYEPSPVFLTYGGIFIYYAYKNDDQNRPYQYSFGMDAWVTESAEESEKEMFDIRDIEGYDSSKSIEQNFRDMIDAGAINKERILFNGGREWFYNEE